MLIMLSDNSKSKDMQLSKFYGSWITADSQYGKK